MSPTDPPAASPGPHTQPQGLEDTPGAQLAHARTHCSISIAELSQRTKISSGTLRALEEERYADIPNARVYVRGFVRAFAAEVGLDPEAVTPEYLRRWEAWARQAGPRRG